MIVFMVKIHGNPNNKSISNTIKVEYIVSRLEDSCSPAAYDLMICGFNAVRKLDTNNIMAWVICVAKALEAIIAGAAKRFRRIVGP